MKEFLSYKKISDGRYLMRLSFEKSGHDIMFECNKFDRNLLFRYVNKEIDVKSSGHVTFDAPTFQIKNAEDGTLYLEGTSLSITLSSLYNGELKISVFGKFKGSDRSTLIGVLRILYDNNDVDVDEKMI